MDAFSKKEGGVVTDRPAMSATALLQALETTPMFSDLLGSAERPGEGRGPQHGVGNGRRGNLHLKVQVTLTGGKHG